MFRFVKVVDNSMLSQNNKKQNSFSSSSLSPSDSHLSLPLFKASLNQKNRKKAEGFSPSNARDSKTVPNTNLSPSEVSPDSNPKDNKKNPDIRHFFDWFRVFGRDLKGITYSHLENLIDQIIKGRFFYKGTPCDFSPLEYEHRPTWVAFHKGARGKFNYLWENSYGVAVFAEIQVDASSSPKPDDLVTAIKVEFSGNPLSELVPRNQQFLIASLLKYLIDFHPGLRLTRIDPCLEVSPEVFPRDEVLQAINRHEYVGYKQAAVMFSCPEKTRSMEENFTYYLGKRTSRRYVRIYNTYDRHKYDAVRIEIECKDHFSKAIQSYLLCVHEESQCPEFPEFPSYDPKDKSEKRKNELINAFIRDYLLSPSNFTFIKPDPKRDGHTGIKERLSREHAWWTHFRETVANSTLRFYRYARRESSIEKTARWMFHKGASFFCSLKHAFGRAAAHWFLDAIMDAKDNGIGCSPFSIYGSTSTAQKARYLVDLGGMGLYNFLDLEMEKIFRQVGAFPLGNLDLTAKHNVLCENMGII